ncbi:hypothetical protein QO002_003906 [Pararhizobium capsulatum DSM 1112]|uniref:Uncharacterized protein n=1 Tax=Pararhizobium capsulatum DSM 1112 TaxID=1121113 RepID=A0ABU0BU30_9HYPH|nr:hypothetical protein [Pararhizobium capsulatum]MDQ0321768.1 hypothetical protein [Pararhizobium capsulatum DSM 1112]
MTIIPPKNKSKTTTERAFDRRDRLILALYAQLKAERQTREALEWSIANGVLSREILEAMAADPVPAVTSDDAAALERLLARDGRTKGIRH